ncbi:MAG: glycosyltransferase [Candidatus Zixiibacteriota bacterium]
MTKLLLISNRFPAHADDGASPFVADFVKGLARHDIDCTVLTPHHFADKYTYSDNVVRFQWGEEHKTIGSLPMVSPTSWLKIYSYFRNGYAEALRLHREKKFDFCLALWAAPSGIFARNLKLQTGLPYAVWCLGSDIHTYPKIPIVRGKIVDVLKDSARVYSDGHELGELASQLSGRQYHFLPSMRKVDYTFSKSEKTEKLFVCPGRVERSKGVFDLLDAFAKVAPEWPDWQLYFIGDGSARTVLEHRIEQYGLAKQVKSLGFVKGENMYRAVAKSSAVVIPTHADSLPLTFGEAMQLKRPVIATDIGDLKHFIERYKVGAVISPHAVDELVDALRDFIQDGPPTGSKFDECVNAISIDRAADTFVDWLSTQIEGVGQREVSVC